MFQWIKRWLGTAPAPVSEIKMAALPTQLNAPVDMRAERHRQRISRLEAALATAKGDRARAFRLEIERRQRQLSEITER